MDFSHLLKKRIFSPGPTTIPLQSQFAAIDNNPYHRSEAFNSILMNCLELLQVFFGTKTSPLILSCSGTGVMEAAMVNLTEPGSKVLMVSGGKFGDRWAKMAQAYSCDCTLATVPWGKVLTPDEMRKYLQKEPKLKAVFFQGVETSAGSYFPVQELVKTVRENSDALIVVDTLSSILCHELNMDAWSIDCAIAASQKGFGAGPGLGFIALSEKARSRFTKRPRFYFNLETEIVAQAKGKTSFTPATQLILNLQSSLQMLSSIGRESLYAYHTRMCDAMRQAVLAIGVEPFVKEHYARSLTTVEVPKGVDGEKLKSLIQKKYAVTIAGGQDHLKGKILRLAHMGFVDPFDLLSTVAALELSLTDLGFRDVLGKGTSVMMKKFPMLEASSK